jgi:hypothetical protein
LLLLSLSDVLLCDKRAVIIALCVLAHLLVAIFTEVLASVRFGFRLPSFAN